MPTLPKLLPFPDVAKTPPLPKMASFAPLVHWTLLFAPAFQLVPPNGAACHIPLPSWMAPEPAAFHVIAITGVPQAFPDIAAAKSAVVPRTRTDRADEMGRNFFIGMPERGVKEMEEDATKEIPSAF